MVRVGFIGWAGLGWIELGLGLGLEWVGLMGKGEGREGGKEMGECIRESFVIEWTDCRVFDLGI